MREPDARIRRGAAIPTVLVGAAAMAVAFAFEGLQGLLGAACATALVVAFFAVSSAAVAWAGSIGPRALFAAGLGTYAGKVLVLGVLLVMFGGTTAFDGEAFALTTAICAVVWMGAHMRALTTEKRLYVDPTETLGEQR
ncbi:hypothetical protein [Salinactinospora qingdaonensis]|uniref:ATP synthase protein I n=1 Tax=Salinactinospora qingdaonensis TaxID=702744 RepID=A0ABP7FS64_9ACTN